MAEFEVLERTAIARRGRRLEYFTIAWNVLEGLIAVVAGAIAGGISSVGFGVDSFIEVTSGATLLWRMSVDAEEHPRERIEQLTFRIVGACFLSLAGSPRMDLSDRKTASTISLSRDCRLGMQNALRTHACLHHRNRRPGTSSKELLR